MPDDPKPNPRRAWEPVEEVKDRRRARFPGFRPRPHRLRELELRRRADLQARYPLIERAELERLVQAYLETVAERDPRAVKEFLILEPTSVCPRRSGIEPLVEIAAVRRLPVIRWLEGELARPAPRGRRGDCSRTLAALEVMAWERGRPEFLSATRQLREPNALRAFAYGYPSGPKRSASYSQLHAMLERADPDLVLHANVELFRQLAELGDDRDAPRHPRAGRHVVVDATTIEADIPQFAPVSQEHALAQRGRRGLARYLTYVDREGQYIRSCNGYKLALLGDLSMTLPLVWRLVPATADERQQAIWMLEDLLTLWPGAPLDALIGDALYDQPHGFASRLVFEFGVQPVFANYGPPSRRYPHAASFGVPKCRHGFMKAFKREEFHSLDRQTRDDSPDVRGVASQSARIRWTCRAGVCRNVTTRPRENPTLYTWYPKAGEDRAHFQRVAMLAHRNSVESIFASVKDTGFGGRDLERAAWADDWEMLWLGSMSLIFLTARRLVHETGLYAETLDAIKGLGLLSELSRTEPCMTNHPGAIHRVLSRWESVVPCTPRSLRESP